jgi:FtsZ-binding cell division protein ZapB
MMAFGGSNIPISEVKELRKKGLTDNQIIEELESRGYSLPQINDALAQAAIEWPEAGGAAEEYPGYAGHPSFEGAAEAPEGYPSPEGALPEELHGRIEEIAESIIDEKWDDLLNEVRKIVEWKEKLEEEVERIKSDVDHLQERFKELHQGVLGKLETYDEKMTEVGTELKAVGKVFREVIPEFVENVKELKSVTKKVKGRKL